MRTVLETKPRSRLSGGELKQLRRDGFVPVSISTRGDVTQQCTVSRQELANVLSRYGASALIELRATGSDSTILVIARSRS